MRYFKWLAAVPIVLGGSVYAACGPDFGGWNPLEGPFPSPGVDVIFLGSVRSAADNSRVVTAVVWLRRESADGSFSEIPCHTNDYCRARVPHGELYRFSFAYKGCPLEGPGPFFLQATHRDYKDSERQYVTSCEPIEQRYDFVLDPIVPKAAQ